MKCFKNERCVKITSLVISFFYTTLLNIFLYIMYCKTCKRKRGRISIRSRRTICIFKGNIKQQNKKYASIGI